MTKHKPIILIMGVQRSGTNALRRSFEHDPRVASFNESAKSIFFDNFFLRPFTEIESIIRKIDSTIVLKAISETKRRSIEEVVRDFDQYDLRIAYLFRDRVNVYYSRAVEFGWGVDAHINDWKERNRKILSALPKHGEMIAIVRYEDLVAHPEVFQNLCAFVGVDGKYHFRQDRSLGRQELSQTLIRKIEGETNDILGELDLNRRFRPVSSCSTKRNSIFQRCGELLRMAAFR